MVGSLIAATPVPKVCGAHLIREHDDLSSLGEPLPDDGGFLQGLALAQQHVIAAGVDR